MNELIQRYTNARILSNGNGDAYRGRIVWSPAKSIWISSMYLLAILGGVLTFSGEVVAVFLFTSALTLCLGHSLGMHRRFIHNSYGCPKWLEYLFVHLGVVVGITITMLIPARPCWVWRKDKLIPDGGYYWCYNISV